MKVELKDSLIGFEIEGTCPITDLKDKHLSYITDKSYIAFINATSQAYILYPVDWDIDLDDSWFCLTNVWIPTEDPEKVFLEYHNEFHGKFNGYITPDGIDPTAIIYDWVKIGKNVCIDPYAVIGRDGFKLIRDKNNNLQRLRHIGGVQIGDFVEIGAGTHIDRATFGNTIIGDYTKIDNNTHIAHNVQIGKNCVIITNVTIGGSCIIEDDVWIGMGAQIRQGICIGEGALINMGAIVTKDVGVGEEIAGNFGINASLFKKFIKSLSKGEVLIKDSLWDNCPVCEELQYPFYVDTDSILYKCTKNHKWRR